MALALLAALAVSVLTATRAGLGADKVWNLDLIAILTALFAGRLLLILMHPHLFRSHPFWLLGLLTVPDIWFALGGALAGVLAGTLYALAEGLPLLRTVDVLAPAVAIASCINRIGAFFGGSAWGTPTHLPWGLVYRSPRISGTACRSESRCIRSNSTMRPPRWGFLRCSCGWAEAQDRVAMAKSPVRGCFSTA
jgi:phosphatidylglycerol:prolipoprotein diacylglycerol transferase